MSQRLPSTKNLQVFLATAEHLNFTHASQALNMTQGALSRQIQSLESLLGVALFYRQARGLSLTAQGEKFIPLAEDILQRLKKAVVDVTENSSRIKLNAPSCITAWLLPHLMSFQQAFPDIEVELTSTIKHQVVPDFEQFDVVIVYGKPGRSSQIQQQLLFEEKLSPLCAPELWKQVVGDGDDWHDDVLTRFMWLHATPEHNDWRLWLAARDRSDLKGQRNQIFSTLDQAMNAAQRGFGIAVGDVTLAQQDLSLHRLCQPFKQAVRSGQSYYLLWPQEADNDMIHSLLQWFAQAADVKTENDLALTTV
ncbi:LysR substrate-binding domain-containing protein [Vibrio proteolyticus]